MYYLKESYQDQIIICNQKDDIIARVMHYDFKTKELAVTQAEMLIEILNSTLTTNIESLGEFVNNGNDYQVFDYVFSPVLSAVEGFTNIEVRDYDDILVYEIAGVEMIDEDTEIEDILKFEEVVKILLIGEGLL